MLMFLTYFIRIDLDLVLDLNVYADTTERYDCILCAYVSLCDTECLILNSIHSHSNLNCWNDSIIDFSLVLQFKKSLRYSLYPGHPVVNGRFLPIHPEYKFPKEFHITHSESNWTNEEKSKELVPKILMPYVEKKREELQLRKI